MVSGLRPEHVLEMVVRPALAAVSAGAERDCATIAAEQLMMGTAAQESRDFTCLRQLAHADGRRGPALGLFQMEPATYVDRWQNYIDYHPKLRRVLMSLAGGSANALYPPVQALAYDLRFAAAMTRVHYLSVPKPLPQAGDVMGFARYWNDHYNRNPNAGTPEEFMAAWQWNRLSALWA